MTKPKHIQILEDAIAIQAERGENYGGIEDNFSRAARLYEAATGDDGVHPYHVAMMLACVKLARMAGNARYMDNYVDAINYIAFAAHFAGQDDLEETPDEDEGDEADPTPELVRELQRRAEQMAREQGVFVVYATDQLPPEVAAARREHAAQLGCEETDLPVLVGDLNQTKGH